MADAAAASGRAGLAGRGNAKGGRSEHAVAWRDKEVGGEGRRLSAPRRLKEGRRRQEERREEGGGGRKESLLVFPWRYRKLP